MPVITIGSVQITAVLDAPFLQDPAYLTPEHTAEFIAEHRDSLDERGLCLGAVTCYLVRTPLGLAIVDTGIGPRARRGFPDGRLDAALGEAGVAPGDVDLVIHTHLHSDHVGWNTVDAADGGIALFFPNARFAIQRAEWEHWMTPERLADDADPAATILRQCVAPLAAAGRVDLVEPGDVLLGAIGFLAVPGHTPGHVAVDVADGGQRAVIIGDASHHPFQVAHPDWPSPIDWDRDLAMASRDALYDRAEREGLLIVGGHWPHPGWGRIERGADGRRRFRPEAAAPPPLG